MVYVMNEGRPLAKNTLFITVVKEGIDNVEQNFL